MDRSRTSVVAIPTAHRPELLALALEKLSAARKPSNLEVHIYVDTVSESRLREVEVVRDLYFPEAFLFLAPPHIQAPSGCWNILNSIKHAAQFADEVFLVEEDVMVYPQFFEWHQSQEGVAASCGRKMRRFESFPWYTNPGSCLRRPLLDALAPHINDEYFSNTIEYCKRFPPADWTSTLDDGLIRRVIQEMDGRWSFPETPVCAHQGFSWYGILDIYANKGGNIHQRVARAKEILSSVRSSDRYAQDFEPFLP
ncbi:Uncharacterised protein [uncultured archaeon]|nr:Uncharacterised protein [uncultured archaeon]